MGRFLVFAAIFGCVMYCAHQTGKEEAAEDCILNMSQEEYDSIQNTLGGDASNIEVFDYWMEHRP